MGKYSILSEIDKDTLTAHETITLRLNISGKGNIKLFKAPDIQFPYDFDESGAVVNLEMESKASLSGNKVIEYSATPRFAGDFTIPPVLFSYFDPKTGRYETLSTPSYTLHVKKDTNAPVQALPYHLTGTIPATPGKEIREIKTTRLLPVKSQDFLYGSNKQILWYTIPVLLLACYSTWRRQKQNARLRAKMEKIRMRYVDMKRQMEYTLICMQENRKKDFNYVILHPAEDHPNHTFFTPFRSKEADDTLFTEFIPLLQTYKLATRNAEEIIYEGEPEYQSTLLLTNIEQMLLLFTAREKSMHFSA